MAVRIVMPTFGMYTAEGSLARWLVEAGAEVEAGELVAEITTEKASYEIESPAAGGLFPSRWATRWRWKAPLYVLAPGDSLRGSGGGVAPRASWQRSWRCAGVYREATWHGLAGGPMRFPSGGSDDDRCRSGLRSGGDANHGLRPSQTSPARAARRRARRRLDRVSAAAHRPIVEAACSPRPSAGPPPAPPRPPRHRARPSAAVPWRIQRRIPLTGLPACGAPPARAMANAVPLS